MTLVTVIILVCAYTAGFTVDSCNNWQAWGACSRSCGGGTRTRSYNGCFWTSDKTGTGKCNEICRYGHSFYSGTCHCPFWRTGRCCDSCRHIYIAHCKSGQQQCGGSPDNIKCLQCESPYYSQGYGKGCTKCAAIFDCQHRHCSNSRDEVCDRCVDNNVFFKITRRGTRCERMCSFNNHPCWPGSCGDELSKNCNCAPGFRKVSTSGETSCQPTNELSNRNFDAIAFGPNGEQKRATGNSTSIQYLYVNYQLSKVDFGLSAQFTVISSLNQPVFIKESAFGVTDATAYLYKKNMKGSEIILKNSYLLVDKSQSLDARPHISFNGSFNAASYTLSNGDRMCLRFEVKGGGYLKRLDTRTNSVLGPVPYQKTTSTNEICYLYDNIAPEHCLEHGVCTSDPLLVDSRITRSDEIFLQFHGYSDPIPPGGKSIHASGIDLYEISVNDVLPSNGQLKVSTKSVLRESLDINSTYIILNMPSEGPKLYCITLEVRDKADNVKQARRFVLYDNTSFIETNPDNQFVTTSASSDTNFRWQTHHNDICITWKDFFFNRFYLDNPLLNPIEPDRYGLINGVFEQSKGPMSVSGTPNVYGITQFLFSWRLDNGNFSEEIVVQNFQNQTLCHHFNLTDGQTYTIKIRPVDIAKNTYEESRIVQIDRSVPNIDNMWLEKNGYESLYVRDRKQLSEMQVHFEALDPHSGIRSAELKFGVSDLETDLGAEAISVIKQINVPTKESSCYCTDVDICKQLKCTIPLDKLDFSKLIQDIHNRTYYLIVKATNHAMLTNFESLDLFVGDPEVTDDPQALITDPLIGGVTAGLTVICITAVLIVVILRRRRVTYREPVNNRSISTVSKPEEMYDELHLELRPSISRENVYTDRNIKQDEEIPTDDRNMKVGVHIEYNDPSLEKASAL